MKFLIVGFGSIGRRHFRNLITLGEREIIFLRSKQSTLPDDEIAEYQVETDLEAALEHQPDAVIVANPTSMHLDVAIPAAEAGCHLFLEKPISHSLEGINRLEAKVNQAGIRVFVGFQFRFHPGIIKLKQLLVNQEIGEPLSVRVHWGEYLPGWHPWEDYQRGYSARKDLGGGVVLTLSHPLDYLRWLVGDVRAIWAFLGKRSGLGLDVEEIAEIGLSFENGVIGSVHLDYIQRPASHRMEFVCSSGTAYWDNGTGIVDVYHANTGTWQKYPLPDGFDRNSLFLAEMDHFLRLIRGQEAPLCSLQDGIKSLELAQGVHKSAREGKLITFETVST